MIVLRLFSVFLYSLCLAWFLEKTLKLKINKWAFILLLSVPDVIITYLANYSYYVAENVIPSFNTRVYIKSTFITCKLILFIMLFAKDSIKKKLKVFFVFQASIAIVEMGAGFLMSNLLHITAQENWTLSLDKYIFSFLISVVVYFLGMYASYKICGGKDFNIPTSLLVLSSGIVFFNCAFVAVVATNNSDNNDGFIRVFLIIAPVFIILLTAILL